MKTKPNTCPGCGAAIQNHNPNGAGFLPPGITPRENLVCQRCYQLKHYNRNSESEITEEKALQLAKEALSMASLAVWVVDFTDLAGTLVPEWAGWCKGTPLLIVINKVDLWPRIFPQEELTVKLKKYLQEILAEPYYFVPLSALRGQGLDALQRIFMEMVPKGKSIAFWGATNVGKSSLLNSILKTEGIGEKITVSSCRGTTQGLISYRLGEAKWRIIDSPGLIPPGRISDTLCPACSTSLSISHGLQSKLWHLLPGQSVVVSGLAGVTLLGDTQRTLIFYTSKNASLHRTNENRIPQLQKENWRTLFEYPCQMCFQKLAWVEDEVEVPQGYDLAWAGLGWFSVRGGPARVKIFHPQGARYVIRPALIGK